MDKCVTARDKSRKSLDKIYSYYVAQYGKRVKLSLWFICDFRREIVSFASVSFRKEKRKEVFVLISI